MTYPSESETLGIRDQFNAIDKDRDGNITVEEFKEALIDQKLDPEEFDYKGFFRKADKNKDGKINFDEFLNAYHDLGLSGSHAVTASPAEKSKKEIDEIFKTFDLDGNGFISEAELTKVLAKQGNPPPKELIKQMMKDADLDGNNKIDRKEFEVIMKK